MSTKLEKMLSGLVESAVGDAIAFHDMEAARAREEKRQANVEAGLTALVGGDGDESVKDEDDIHTGAPKRAPGTQPGQGLKGPDVDAVLQDPDEDASNVGAEGFIDKFNIIRSGRSMNDRDIEEAITAFLGKLSPEQKSTFFGFLRGIGKIVAPAADVSRSAPPPEESEAQKAQRVQMLQKRREDHESSADRRSQEREQSIPSPKAHAASSHQAPAAPKVAKAPADDAEDTRPPIRVGRRAVETTSRRKALLLEVE